MQPNKSKVALQIGALLLGSSCAFTTTADPFNVTVNTIGDVTIATVTPLDFGTNIKTDALGVCAMTAAAPANTAVFADANVVAGSGVTAFGALAGTGCVGASGTPGIYSVTGEPGLDVTITLTADGVQAGGDFGFSPTGGCAVIHDNDNAATGDVCTALVVGTGLTGVTIADGVDLATTANETHFTVGGTVTVGATALTSDFDYAATFNVEVTY